MPEILLPYSVLFGFLLVLVRVSGVFLFVPVPGLQKGPPAARVVLSAAATMALYARWPAIAEPPTVGVMLVWLASEAALGIAAGVVVGFISEAFLLGAQVLGLQAGYGYASMIDPNTQADSGILVIMAQLLAGLLFFTTGTDRWVIHAFANSLEVFPPGTFIPQRGIAEHIIAAGASVFTLAFRLALPVAALLLLIDLALGLLGRINSHVQVITLAFPMKMLLALFALASLMIITPKVYQKHAAHMTGVLQEVVNRR